MGSIIQTVTTNGYDKRCVVGPVWGHWPFKSALSLSVLVGCGPARTRATASTFTTHPPARRCGSCRRGWPHVSRFKEVMTVRVSGPDHTPHTHLNPLPSSSCVLFFFEAADQNATNQNWEENGGSYSYPAVEGGGSALGDWVLYEVRGSQAAHDCLISSGRWFLCDFIVACGSFVDHQCTGPQLRALLSEPGHGGDVLGLPGSWRWVSSIRNKGKNAV
jgi:hypothetical protein